MHILPFEIKFYKAEICIYTDMDIVVTQFNRTVQREQGIGVFQRQVSCPAHSHVPSAHGQPSVNSS